MLRATLDAPFALDASTGVPVGTAIPGNIRILAGPFNIIGAFALVVGAIFSAYVFMPKQRVLGRRALPPIVAQIYGALAVAVNFIASLPRAAVDVHAAVAQQSQQPRRHQRLAAARRRCGNDQPAPHRWFHRHRHPKVFTS